MYIAKKEVGADVVASTQGLKDSVGCERQSRINPMSEIVKHRLYTCEIFKLMNM